jgi:hypothetical protein
MVGPLNSRRDRPSRRRIAEKVVAQNVRSNWIGLPVHCTETEERGTVVNAWPSNRPGVTELCIELPDLSVIVSDSENWVRKEVTRDADDDS